MVVLLPSPSDSSQHGNGVPAPPSCSTIHCFHQSWGGMQRTSSILHLSRLTVLSKILLTNNLFLSLTMSSGRLFSQYHRSKNCAENGSAAMSVLDGVMCMSAPRKSVIVTMQLKPSSSGQGPIKSIAMELPCSSGMGRGCSGPAGLVVLLLFLWQSMQVGMYALRRSHLTLGQ